MNRFRQLLIGMLTVIAVSSVSASISHTPTQLVDIACPTNWKNLDVTIDPSSLPWSNTSDKSAFKDYQDTYHMNVSKTWGSMDDRYADDPLTVASECLLRKNTVVDNHFNKQIDILTALRERINLVPLIMLLLD